MNTCVTVVSVFGLAGSTFLFPVAAYVLNGRAFGEPRPQFPPAPDHTPFTVDILIPAHNEEAVLASTLTSMQAAIAVCREYITDIQVNIHVGADACSDRTAEIARTLGADVREYTYHQKWQTLRALVRRSRAQWCVLADAGVIWPENFLLKLVGFTGDPQLIAIAPAYRPAGSRRWEKLHWLLERAIKRIESLAGGPISVHGATVAYRGATLRRAFETLGEGPWLNDDVVLPWILRVQNPKMRIYYWAGQNDDEKLRDEGATGAREYGRRRRIVVGNLQWLSLWRLNYLHRNPSLVLLGLRRVFRLLWAYWALMLVFALLGARLGWLLAFAGGIAVAGVGAARGLLASGGASLMIPYYWILSRVKKGGWLWN